MQKKLSSSLSLKKLFYTQKGREALFLFLTRTEIATRKWLITAGSIEGGNSYQAPSKEILVSKRTEIKQQISQLKRAFLEENYNLLILLQPTQGDEQEKRYQNSGKIIGNRIKAKENTILESVKETTPFLLKPLRINILKGYNQLSFN